jgi:hypothetical protein
LYHIVATVVTFSPALLANFTFCQREALHEGLIRDVFDPLSIQVRGQKKMNGGAFCGEINAKNRMSGNERMN